MNITLLDVIKWYSDLPEQNQKGVIACIKAIETSLNEIESDTFYLLDRQMQDVLMAVYIMNNSRKDIYLQILPPTSDNFKAITLIKNVIASSNISP